ncbi:MAG: FtsX-like permease family protein, partial [Opitutaceae bacterium]
KQADLTDHEALGTVYFPFGYRSDSSLFVVVRTGGLPVALASSVRTIVRKIDPELPVNDLRPMDARIADSLLVRRSPALLAGIFAAISVLLTAVGTYGVLSYAVAQRRREIGVRVALGAQAGQIRRHFLGLGLRLLALGTVLGGLGAIAAGRLISTALFGVPAWDGLTFLGTAGILGAVALLALWLPAHRAAKIDPMEALRCE